MRHCTAWCLWLLLLMIRRGRATLHGVVFVAAAANDTEVSCDTARRGVCDCC